MKDPKPFPIKNEVEFNKFLVREYLKYASVDEVFRIHKYSLPVSYANYQRILDKWGIVKAAGPNSKFSEMVNFLAKMVKEEIPLEKLYKKTPHSFRTSVVTLYRILSYVREGITRRVGTALVITPESEENLILIAKDMSTPRLDFGKPYGSFTIPMGFSSKVDTRNDAVLRVLQQEVFTNETIEKEFPSSVIPKKLEPFMYLDVLDVRVAIYHLVLPKKYSSISGFSSFKLQDFKFVKLDRILNKKESLNYRFGLENALLGYKTCLDFKRRKLSFNPLQAKSELNRELVVTVDFPRE